MAERTPHEIASETVKLMTSRKLAPTPDNYRALYLEIAGVTLEPPFPADELMLIAKALPTKTPGQLKQRGLLEYAVGKMSWDGVRNALMHYGGFSPAATSEAPAAGARPTPLLGPDALPAGLERAALTADFLGQIARMIEYARPALGSDDARFAEQTDELLRALRDTEADITQVKQMLAGFSHRLSFAAEEQVEIKVTLLRLLHLVMQNVGELSLEDNWLKGQIDALMEVATPPITLRRLDDVEHRLKDVIYKQTEAKGRALEAQEEMRTMLATFIERLSQMTESTSSYHVKMEESARQIEQARTLTDITPVLKEVVGATRSIAQESLGARDELRGMREKAQLTDAQIAKLHVELDRVSAQARHDPLTGALNRKGLDEAVEREVKNFRRKEKPLCVALLDIDNFKQINDERGHSTGDAALAHLAEVARQCMRPQDTLARYGGEEFVILLPDTPLDRAVEAMTRLQRELTKRNFLTGEERILITFSAGVAQLAPDEAGASAIKRADQAMYLAKRAGKNRVIGA